MRRYLRGPLVSIASQLTGLIQLAAILFLVGADNSTDSYFYLFTLGLTPILILMVGLMYPLLLNEERITLGGLRRIRWAAPASSGALVLGGSIWLSVTDSGGPWLGYLTLAVITNSVAQCAVWFRAVAAEAGGDPLWISGVALPANILAVVSLIFPWPNSGAAMAAMTFALALGNLMLYVVMRRRQVGVVVLQESPATRVGSARGSYWFLGKASVGYAGQATMQSIAVTLPASSVTFLNLANKIVGAASSTFVNALMPLVINQSTETTASGRKFLRLSLPIMALGGGALIVIAAVVNPELILTSIIVTCWLLTSTAAAVAQRMAFRFLDANASRISMAVILVVTAAAAASALSPSFSLNVLLGALAIMDGVTAALLLWALRDRTVSAIVSILVACLVYIWIATLWSSI